MAKNETGVVAFVEAPLPKSTAGRRGIPMDEAFADSIVNALREFDTLEIDGTKRPRALGHPEGLETRGKASSLGSKYKDYVSKQINKPVKLRIYSNTTNEKGEATAPFFWQVYVPLSAGTASEGAESE